MGQPLRDADHDADAAPGRAPRGRERRVVLLGSTGSIGTQTLDVIEHLNALHARGRWPTPYRVVGLAAGRNARLLAEQARRHPGARLAIAQADAAVGDGVIDGEQAAERLVREVECDLVLGAMVGAAGLPATLAAVELGRDVALANKETLVAAGGLVVPAARASGSRLLPVDSEHCAVWQALASAGACDGPPGPACPPMVCGKDVARIVLTASGGALRTWTAERTRTAGVEEVLRHPTWQMGPKVTVDSASLTNKALEIVEAHWLFGVPGERIAAVIHPQSIVHALVEFADGNVIAQLAAPDMRTPIQYAMTWPHRPDGCSRRLDWARLGSLEFAEPDHGRFPALRAAYEVIRRGGTAGAVFNAANETAVGAFLDRAIPFGRITELALAALEALGSSRLRGLDDVLAADAEARRWVASRLPSAAASPRS